MTPRSLFNIILRIFGLFFIKDIIEVLPQLVATLIYFTNAIGGEGLWTFIGLALILGFYGFVAYQLLFRSNIILDKLQLDQEFDQTEFSFTISTTLVLTIAVMVTGGIVLTEEIPHFCQLISSYFQVKQLPADTTDATFSNLVFSGVKIIIGFLLLGERKRIVGLIEQQPDENMEA